MELTITAAAQSFIRRMIRFNGGDAAAGFRLVVTPGGCSGLNSEFTVEKAPQDGDSVVDFANGKIFLPMQSKLLLTGATVDFADTPTQSGLVFQQPQGFACGCSSASDSATGVATVDIATITRKQ